MEKRTTLSLLFFVKRTKLLKNGEAPVYMRITIQGRRMDLSLNRSVNLKIWSSEKGACVGNTKDAKSINLYIVHYADIGITHTGQERKAD